MDMDQYHKRIEDIFKRLQEIADTTRNMAIAGTAKSGDERFDALMQRHAELTEEGSKLTDDMLKRIR